jgi:hypothetical protein
VMRDEQAPRFGAREGDGTYTLPLHAAR